MVGYKPPETNIGDRFGANLNKILQAGTFNENMKLPAPPKPKSYNLMLGLPGAPNPSVGGGSYGPTGTTSLDQLMRAIRQQESGGRYTATNPSGALGAYQILWSNLASNNGSDWDRQAIGRDVSRSEFLNNAALQDQIARYKLGEYLRKWGAAGAAATWYGGSWGRAHMYDKRPQAGYPSMYDYVMAILAKAK